MQDLLVKISVGLLPVVIFLIGLVVLDSFKLVQLRAVLTAILAGGAIAGVSYVANVRLMELLALDLTAFSRYVAPAVEETLKALVPVYLLRTHRIGFPVDAAIFGFAVGAGFALIENVYYLNLLPDAAFGVWLLRGLGTAIMHGGTTAIFGIVSKTLGERNSLPGPAVYLPGLLVAIVVHSVFNHFFLSPVVSTLVVLAGLPPLLALVFHQSERSLRGWLGVGFDADAELLRLILSGRISESRVGRYLQTVRERFSGAVIADMMCYLRLHLELSLRAKGELMLRESGFKSRLEPDLQAKFDEMKYLERSIGATGRMAMAPFLHVGGKEVWQFYMLGRK